MPWLSAGAGVQERRRVSSPNLYKTTQSGSAGRVAAKELNQNSTMDNKKKVLHIVNDQGDTLSICNDHPKARNPVCGVLMWDDRGNNIGEERFIDASELPAVIAQFLQRRPETDPWKEAGRYKMDHGGS